MENSLVTEFYQKINFDNLSNENKKLELVKFVQFCFESKDVTPNQKKQLLHLWETEVLDSLQLVQDQTYLNLKTQLLAQISLEDSLLQNP
jgi:hypothetical protein